jgi:hypothetical protein
MSMRNTEVRGAFVHGDVDISVINHLQSTLSDVRLELVEPASGSIGDDATGTVSIGDVEVNATGVASVPFAIDAGFIASSEPYLVKVTFTFQGAHERSEAVVLVPRTEGGAL